MTEPRDTEQGAPSDEDAVSRKGTGGHGPDCPTGGGAPSLLERLEALGRAPEPFALLHEWPWLYDELKRLTAEVERLRNEVRALQAAVENEQVEVERLRAENEALERANLLLQDPGFREAMTNQERARQEAEEVYKSALASTRQRLHEIEEAARECVVGYDWCALPITVESASGGPEETACGDCAPCRLRSLLERSPDGE